jgi:hypothetical protein
MANHGCPMTHSMHMMPRRPLAPIPNGCKQTFPPFPPTHPQRSSTRGNHKSTAWPPRVTTSSGGRARGSLTVHQPQKLCATCIIQPPVVVLPTPPSVDCTSLMGKNSLHPGCKSQCLHPSHVLILDPLSNHSFLKSTYVVVRKWIQY